MNFSYLNARCGEVGDLKLDIYRRLALDQIAIYAGEKELCLHEVLLASGERLDGPADCLLLRNVATVACKWIYEIQVIIQAHSIKQCEPDS